MEFNIDERLNDPIYIPRESFEMKKVTGGNSGCEDPRLTKIGKNIYMCYTAFDGIGPPRVAITSITEKNFLEKNWQWEKPVLITPAGFDDKDTCIFPEKINGKYFILHRVGSEMCGDYFKSLNFKTDIVKKCIRVIGPRINIVGFRKSRHFRAAPQNKIRLAFALSRHFQKSSHLSRRSAIAGFERSDHGYFPHLRSDF